MSVVADMMRLVGNCTKEVKDCDNCQCCETYRMCEELAKAGYRKLPQENIICNDMSVSSDYGEYLRKKNEVIYVD